MPGSRWMGLLMVLGCGGSPPATTQSATGGLCPPPPQTASASSVLGQSTVNCPELPSELLRFVRGDCRTAALSTQDGQSVVGVEAEYTRDGCYGTVVALPIGSQALTLYYDGALGSGAPYSVGPTELRRATVDGALLTGWPSAQHVYWVSSPADFEGLDELIAALAAAYPPSIDRPAAVPTCDATGNVQRNERPPATAPYGDSTLGLSSYFEANAPAGIEVQVPGGHPLRAFGFADRQVVHSIDGIPATRERFTQSLRRFTRAGFIDYVVSNDGAAQLRCLRAELKIAQPPPPPPPPPPVSNTPRQGRHCTRSSDRCWDCADFTFPANVGCARRCSRGQICVNFAGRDQCLATTRVCCMEGTQCNLPPGCPEAASSCSSSRRRGYNDRCTLLNACPPLPR